MTEALPTLAFRKRNVARRRALVRGGVARGTHLACGAASPSARRGLSSPFLPSPVRFAEALDPMSRILRSCGALVAFLVPACSGKEGATPRLEASLYVALDQEHSEALVDLFTKESGIAVKARFDNEAQKTVGLVNNLIEESSRPICDVFWNNELAHTVRLAQKGLLEPYVSPAAARIPSQWRDATGLWAGFAARARVIIVNTKRMGTDPAGWPKSIHDFADPKWKGNCAIARPLTGTTLTHFTALHEAMGAEAFGNWLDALNANEVRWLQSNGATMRETSKDDGDLLFALTDTDDYHVALQKGLSVGCVFPDQQEGGLGTMLIPNSVALVKGGPNPEAGRKLIDFVVSERVEALLAAAKSAQIPLRDGVVGPAAPSILPIDRFRPMVWDPAKVAAALEARSAEFARRFGGG